MESFATEMLFIKSEKELIEKVTGTNRKYKILGGGSNILLTSDVADTILKNEIKGIEIIEDNNEFCLVKAGAGENWHELVLWSLNNNLGGLENLSLIPGCVGAAPVQNIGAYGVELKDVLVGLDGVFIPEGKRKSFENKDCQFAYRNSIFKSSLKDLFCITCIVIKLSKHAELKLEYGNIRAELGKLGIKNPTIQDVSNAVIKIRNSKLPDPKVLGNAGSFFKNCLITSSEYQILKKHFPDIPGFNERDGRVKVPSGWLIEQCGWKGKRKGNAGCYDKQALVLVNYGQANGKDILSLAEDIINSVLGKFGITLIPEVNIW